MSGPSTCPTLPTVKLRVLAAATRSRSTMRGHDRPARRRGDGEDAGLDEDQGEDQSEAADGEQGLCEQRQGDDPGRHGGPEVELAPIDHVGDRAAVEAEDHDRHEAREADEPDVERRPGERIDLHRHGHLGQHRADERGALADQQPPVGGALASGRTSSACRPRRARKPVGRGPGVCMAPGGSGATAGAAAILSVSVYLCDQRCPLPPLRT